MLANAICGGEAKPDAGRTKAPTFDEFAKSWTSGELHKLYPDHVPLKTTTRHDESILRDYINPILSDVPLPLVTLDHCDEIMSRLPPSLASATRRHVAQCMRRVLGLAVYPGRHIKANPIPKGWLPRVKQERVGECLHVDEDAALVSSPAVPTLW